MVACGAPAISPAISPAASSSPSPTVAVSASPSSSASVPPSAPPVSAAPLPSYAATGDCSIEMLGDPVLDETMYFSGEGFTPSSYLDVEFSTPDAAAPTVFDGEGNRLLLTRDSGRLERWDVTATESDEVGDWRMTFKDGVCEASIWFTVTAS